MTLCLFHDIQFQGEMGHLISFQKGRFSLRAHRKSMGTLESQVHAGCEAGSSRTKCGRWSRGQLSAGRGHVPGVRWMIIRRPVFEAGSESHELWDCWGSCPGRQDLLCVRHQAGCLHPGTLKPPNNSLTYKPALFCRGHLVQGGQVIVQSSQS